MRGNRLRRLYREQQREPFLKRCNLRRVEERSWESFEGFHLRRRMMEADLQQLTVGGEGDLAWFSPLRKRQKHHYVLKSTHGHRKRGETLKEVVYGVKVVGEASPMWGGMGGVRESSRKRHRMGSVSELYGLLVSLKVI